MKLIPYAAQSIDNDDIQAVVNALKSQHLTQGPLVSRFEEKLAEYCGAKYAVAVSNGTAALHLASLAAGIKSGDEVITSPITFVASANCVLYCGGTPVFADICPNTANIDPREIKKKITSKTKAIIPVHFAGQACDLIKIRSIARKNKLVVIEDASHALGASYRGSKIGSCRYSDMTTFSFHAIKTITTGEGGAILTNNKNYYRKLQLLRTHGITKDEKFLENNPGPWYYEMTDLGFNYRLTDFQCALGLSQLKKADAFLRRRRNIARKYDRVFAGLPNLKFLEVEDPRSCAYHLYVVMANFDKLGLSRGQVMAKLKAAGVGTQVHYIPVYKHPHYRKNIVNKSDRFPCSEAYYGSALSLPLYPKMSEVEVERVINRVVELFE